MSRAASRWLDRIDAVLSAIAAVAIVAMMALICADAVGRYVFRMPLPAANDIVSHHLLVALVFLMLSANYASGGHVRLDVTAGFLDRVLGSRAAQERLVAGLCLAVFVPFGLAAGADAIERSARMETTLGLVPLPVWLSHVVVAIGVWSLNARLTLDLFAPPSVRETGTPEARP